MQLKSLRVLVAVAESGSFVAAAERLHTVQSNVTAHIKKLETELALQLFDRGARARMTSAGQLLYGYAKQMLHSHDQALAVLRAEQQPKGLLHIGSMETTAALRLPPLLSRFHQRYPEVELRLNTAPTAELSASLLEGRFDCVLICGALAAPRISQFVAFEESLVLVSAEPITQMPTAQQWLHSTFLVFRQGCSYRQRVELLLARCGVSAVRMMEFGTLDALLGCVAAGMGYALLPKAVVEAHQGRFSIHALALPADLAQALTYCCAGEEAGWSPALRAFIEMLQCPEVRAE